MITQERLLQKLERFDITQDQLEAWVEEMGLDIPIDKQGHKVYSPLHINLFKNIKKHLSLGRSLHDIQRMIVLPKELLNPTEDAIDLAEADLEADHNQLPGKAYGTFSNMVSTPATPDDFLPISQGLAATPKQNPLFDRLLKEIQTVEQPSADSLQTSPVLSSNVVTHPAQMMSLSEGQVVSLSDPTAMKVKKAPKRFASPPVALSTSTLKSQPGQHAGLVVLIDKLMREKDELQKNLVQTEKQNTHLYQANTLFQERLKALNEKIEQLEEQMRSRESFKLIDEKSKLQKQLIDAEQRQISADKKLSTLSEEVTHLKKSLSNKYTAANFVGNWLEEATLKEVVFDNFGINIENKRNRMFRVTHPPERFYGPMALIETIYDYKTNALWKRSETLVLAIANDNKLEGELIAEYTLDGTPVAKAIYKAVCYRNGLKLE